jgi:hypothetical protein
MYFKCISSIFMVCFDVFQCFSMYLKVFECTSMYLNEFANIIIRILPSHSHYNVFAMLIHLHICFFTIYNDPLPNMIYHYTLSLISIDPFQLYTIYENITYQFLLFKSIHHPTFHVVTGCANHSGAQVSYKKKFIMIVSF